MGSGLGLGLGLGLELGLGVLGPGLEPVLVRLLRLGGDARHRAAALRRIRLTQQRGARTERVLAHLVRVSVRVRVMVRVSVPCACSHTS